MAVIAVFNQKGGVGKTTTTLNVAASLALLERKPVLLDLDPQAHLSLSLGLRGLSGSVCVSAFFREGAPLGALIRRMPGGLRVIPGHPDLSKVDAMLGATSGVAGKLRQALANSSDLLNHPVLLDCAPALGVLSMNALVAADRVLVPVTPDYLSMQGLSRLDIALRVLEQSFGRGIQRRIVLTRYDDNRALSRDALANLRQRYADMLCDTRISDDPALAESPAHGMDVFAYDSDSPGAHDYRLLTMELLSKGFFQ